jgi:hypothetical protein
MLMKTPSQSLTEQLSQRLAAAFFLAPLYVMLALDFHVEVLDTLLNGSATSNF